MSPKPKSEFEQAARAESRRTLLTEFWEFFWYNKKWWMLPIIITLLLLGALALISGSAAAPFIYTLF